MSTNDTGGDPERRDEATGADTDRGRTPSAGGTDDRGTPPEPTARPRSRTLFVGGGILVALLGLAAVVSPFVTGIAITFVLGVVLLVGAVGHLVAAFSGRGWTGFAFQVLLAILYAVAGIALFVEPVVGLVTLTLLLVAYLLVEGVVEVVQGFRVRPARGWGWLVASGAVSVVLAVLLFAGFPATAAWAVGLLVGLGLLTTGISMVVVGLSGGREAGEAVERPAGGGAGPD